MHDVNASHVILNYALTGLFIVLICCLIPLTQHVIQLLTQAKTTVSSLEATKTELDATLKNVNTMLETEVTPTIRVLRATVANLETTTRAVADTTEVARKFATKVAPYANRIPQPSTAIAHSNPLVNIGRKLATTVLTAAGAKILTGLGNSLIKRKEAEHSSSSSIRNGGGKMKELPPGEHGDLRVHSNKGVKKWILTALRDHLLPKVAK